MPVITLKRSSCSTRSAPTARTKSVATALSTIGGSKKTLIVDAKSNDKLVRGAKNLATSQWLAPEGLNVYDILRHDTLVLTKEAAEAVTAALKSTQGEE